MCGRYATSASKADLAALFDASGDPSGDADGELAPDYNVAPTDPAPIIRISAGRGGRVISVARWGFLPSWAKDARGAARMINARAETVASSRVFARPFAERRCLVPVDGWYEWRRGPGGARQAYFMTPDDGGRLALAGLWGVWRGDGGARLTFSVLTTAAVGDLALVHDRMPLVLPPDRWADWLADAGREAAGGAAHEADRLLAPPSENFTAKLEIRPVGPRVGDVRNGGPELVELVPAQPLKIPSVDEGNPSLF